MYWDPGAAAVGKGTFGEVISLSQFLVSICKMGSMIPITFIMTKTWTW
jgi:hypothetical protein